MPAGRRRRPTAPGISWLGPALVTPAVIGAYLWIWTGFAMVLIGAGLAALQVFDLVYVIAPGPVQEDATVLATQMWLVSFGGGNDQGMGSALGVLLLLVVPAMVFNVRRFRRSQR
ncbi:ABC-type sugar transport system permease subunit [Streptomyces griseoviridis]|uniref:ABC-type sugar transport system permease subunit n=2 Tax=Streptomyces TaxID=1883 RepID=A0ABT9L8J4_STRGD|nr:ABC-type sugar transport system permease subunit [Streptomyces griseoviridis]GGT05020.1 hypothetical protein GCM10010240_43010 [Streptomyces griseoviridis]